MAGSHREGDHGRDVVVLWVSRQDDGVHCWNIRVFAGECTVFSEGIYAINRMYDDLHMSYFCLIKMLRYNRIVLRNVFVMQHLMCKKLLHSPKSSLRSYNLVLVL